MRKRVGGIMRHDRQGRVTPRRVPGGRNRGASRSQPLREWIGGRLSPPFVIHDRAEPYRPDLVLWMELPDAFVVGQAVVMPEDTQGAVARTLRNALTQPAGGSPRQPDLIRVADAATAAEVRAEVAGAIPVTVAPTPELDDLLQHLIATMPASQDHEPSYLVGRSATTMGRHRREANLTAASPRPAATVTRPQRRHRPRAQHAGHRCRNCSRRPIQPAVPHRRCAFDTQQRDTGPSTPTDPV